jgi:nucleoid-associated protein YgaU
VRLTRRGRLLLVVLSLAVGLAIGACLGSWLGGQGHGALRLASESSVVVRPGDTLWSIATTVAGDDDVRGVVDRIEQLNHLTGAALRPGQVLQLP